MTRFGRPGFWKDLIGATMVMLAFLLLGVQAAPAAHSVDAVEIQDTVTGSVEVETLPEIEDYSVQI